jgi:gas vesicle protein
MTQQRPGSATSSGGSGGSGGGVSDQASQVAQTAKESGSQVAQTAKESGSQVAQTAVEQVKTVAGEAQQQTRNLLGEAQGQVREQAKTQQDKARDGLRSLGDELRSMASNGGQSGPATDLAHQASQRVHSAADWLEQREPGDLLAEVRRFAQRRPGAFLVGALLAGVAAGRLTRGVIAASSDKSDAEQPVSLEYGSPQLPTPEEMWTPAATSEPGFSSPYDQAMAPPGTPPAYVTDPTPASGAPSYGAPTYGGAGYESPGYGTPGGFEPQGRP